MNKIDLGFCWSDAECSPEAGLAHLRNCGFDGIELWPDALNRFPLRQWRTALQSHGMSLLQICPYFDFVSSIEKFQNSREMLRSALYAASVLSCRRIRVFTGPPWGEGVVSPASATEQQWERAIQGLKEFCAEADHAGVELCLECHGGSLMEDSRNTLRLVESVGARNLSVNLQLPLEGEAADVSVQSLGHLTTHLHLHNWTGGFNEGEMTFLGEGKVDWKPIICRLSLDFARPLCLSVEHASHGGVHDWRETAVRDGAFLTALRSEVESLRQKQANGSC